MADDEAHQLWEEIDRLRKDVDRYRTATEDALQQLDWCIGYFVGANKNGLARSLGANRSYIRRHLLHREEAPTPTDHGDDQATRRNA
ncbi:MAG TPA: hypothetical protein VFL69_10720 [Marmoricola sp.]|jgi:hypothetical protein|nr:hypothetical protein [Marmoricola sp.]